jgi:acetyl esterase/lipase
MKKLYSKFSKIIIVTLTILFISCSSDDNEVIVKTTPLAASQMLDVSYGDSTQQKYDLYLPEGRTKETTKVFILVHGGSWVSGDKNDLNYFVNLIKPRFPNYAIVNINYRLADITTNAFPMQINDIENIILDLKSNADTYQISNNYGFIGVSAGAHLSMLYSYKFDTSNEVDMVCSIVGPTNFTDNSYVNNPDYAQVFVGIQSVTGVNYAENPEYYESLSPYHVVTNSAPPTILFYGDQDELIPTSQGVEMHDKLNSKGVVNEFTLYEGEGHGWEGVNALDTNIKLNAFISSHF